MVNLGIVNNLNLLPPNTLWVNLKKHTQVESILEINKNLTTLNFFFNPENNFGESFYSLLKGLKANQIALNPTYLVPIYNLSLEDSLLKWGETIFPFFKNWDGTLYFEVKNFCLQNTFKKWSKKFTHVCFKNKYNLIQSQENKQTKKRSIYPLWKLKVQNS